MYALPQNTLLSKQIPKKAIFKKFTTLPPAKRQRIDADIARIDIVAQLSPQTLPAITEGSKVKAIYVMQVSLKTKSYSKESISLLAHHIPQRMLFALRHESEVQLAIVHNESFHAGPWLAQDEVRIPLEGLNFDTLWTHIVAFVADIDLDPEQTLEQQIQNKQEQERLRREIAQLVAKMNRERALNKQMQIRSQINELTRNYNLLAQPNE